MFHCQVSLAKSPVSPALKDLNCFISRASVSPYFASRSLKRLGEANGGGQPSSWSPKSAPLMSPLVLGSHFWGPPYYHIISPILADISQATSRSPLLARSTCGPHGDSNASMESIGTPIAWEDDGNGGLGGCESVYLEIEQTGTKTAIASCYE